MLKTFHYILLQIINLGNYIADTTKKNYGNCHPEPVSWSKIKTDSETVHGNILGIAAF